MAVIDTEAVLAVFRVLASEFASTADATVNAVTSLLGQRVSPAAFGGATSEAIARLVAHELTLQARDAAASAGGRAAGPVTSVRAGDLSVTYGAVATVTHSYEEAELQQTRHGLAYLRLRDSRGGVTPYIVA